MGWFIISSMLINITLTQTDQSNQTAEWPLVVTLSTVVMLLLQQKATSIPWDYTSVVTIEAA